MNDCYDKIIGINTWGLVNSPAIGIEMTSINKSAGIFVPKQGNPALRWSTCSCKQFSCVQTSDSEVVEQIASAISIAKIDERNINQKIEIVYIV